LWVDVGDVANGEGRETEVSGDFSEEIKLVSSYGTSANEIRRSIESAVPSTGAEAEALILSGHVYAGFNELVPLVDATEDILAGVSRVEFVFDFRLSVASHKGGGSGQGANGFAVVLHFCMLVIGCCLRPQLRHVAEQIGAKSDSASSMSIACRKLSVGRIVHLSEIIVQNIFDRNSHSRQRRDKGEIFARQAGIEFMSRFSLFMRQMMEWDLPECDLAWHLLFRS
jgi:hypothetical protein